jgi:Integrase zinc binding domain/Integrase core domain
LAEYHAGAIGGHFGRDITIKRIREKYWWPTIWKSVADFVRTCDICQRYGPKERHNELHPFRPIHPFEFVFMDFVISLPITPRKNRHLITMTEGFTKWIEAKPTREATSKIAAKFLMEDVICRYGVPTVVVTDNGSHFRGEFHELCRKMNIWHRFATAYHPQTSGQDERTNGLLLNRLRKWRENEYNKWDEDITASLFACNTRKIDTIAFSAIESLMGFSPKTASDLRFNKKSKVELKEQIAQVGEGKHKDKAERIRMVETIRDEAVRCKEQKLARMKAKYDRKVRPLEFNIGDEILLYDSTLSKQWSRKLDERWIGPFTINWKGSLGAYGIEDDHGKVKMVSGDNIKRYHRRFERGGSNLGG